MLYSPAVRLLLFLGSQLVPFHFSGKIGSRYFNLKFMVFKKERMKEQKIEKNKSSSIPNLNDYLFFM